VTDAFLEAHPFGTVPAAHSPGPRRPLQQCRHLAAEAAGRIDEKLLLEIVTTNLVGPIRLSSELIEHLKQRDDAVIAYTSSIVGFMPLVFTTVYSATKAALQSYALSQRFLLKGTAVRVFEMTPPWVRTDLMNSREAKQAMPRDQFIGETMAVFATDADDRVESARPFRANVGPKEHAFIGAFQGADVGHCTGLRSVSKAVAGRSDCGYRRQELGGTRVCLENLGGHFSG
jgi:NAD(P)-dependent dehydrogenase (short-subunit alcohol dehydrogenase family)